MKRYVLLVGGSGARVAEAVLCAGCAGVFQADSLDVLLADLNQTGVRSADMLRAKYADYACVQEALSGQKSRRETVRPFRTALKFHAWPSALPGGVTTLAEMTAGSETDSLLCQALFDPEAAALDLRDGFHGRRTLGQTVFAGMLHASAQDESDALAGLISQMNAALDSDEEVRVVVAGSVCGGMGAAGMPLLIRHVQEMTQDRVKVAAVLLAANGDHEDAAQAHQALAEYAHDGLCDTVCVLGLPRSSCSNAPADYPHLTDWLAVYCMDVLLHRPSWLTGVFTVKAEDGPLSWSIFGKAAARYRLGYGRLIKAAAAWNYIIGPQVNRRLRHPVFLRDRLLGWYAHFFRGAREMRDMCLVDAERLTRLMSVVLLWMGGLYRTLPPEMRYASGMMAAQQEAEEHYAALTELVSQLAVLDEDVQESARYEQSFVYRHGTADSGETETARRRIDAVRAEVARQAAEQERLNRRVGGAAAMQLLQASLAEAEASCAELDARYEEANRRIDHAEEIAAEEDLYRITDARTKLKRMERHKKMLDARAEHIRGDVQRVAEEALRYEKPTVSARESESGMLAIVLMERVIQPERRMSRAETEKWWGSIVLPEDGIPFKKTLKGLRHEPVDDRCPVMSLLQALLMESMLEV